jgi:hypothetical protein
MKEIPAGVSKKTGKPYSAFFACDGCKQTHNPANVAPPVQAPPPPTPPPYSEPTIGEQFAQKDQDKQELIMKQLCLKSSCTLYSNQKVEIEQVLKTADRFLEYLHGSPPLPF